MAARPVAVVGGGLAAARTIPRDRGAAPAGVDRTVRPLHVLRSLDGSTALADDIKRIGILTIIGGGLTGCEAAAGTRAALNWRWDVRTG